MLFCDVLLKNVTLRCNHIIIYVYRKNIVWLKNETDFESRQEILSNSDIAGTNDTPNLSGFLLFSPNKIPIFFKVFGMKFPFFQGF